LDGSIHFGDKLIELSYHISIGYSTQCCYTLTRNGTSKTHDTKLQMTSLVEHVRFSISDSRDMDTATNSEEDDDGDGHWSSNESDYGEPRAKRVCHAIKVRPPGRFVVDEFLKRTSEMERTLKDNGYTKMRVPPVPPKERSVLGSSKIASNSHAQRILRIIRNKWKRHISMFCVPAFVSSAGLPSHCHITTIFRDHANHTYYPQKRTPKEGAAQQTTRFQTGGVGSTQIAQQVTTNIALGMASLSYNGDAVVSDPQSSDLMCTESVSFFRTLSEGSRSLHVCAVDWFCEDMPRCMAASNFVDSMRRLAFDELHHCVVSSATRPSTQHLKLTCEKLCGESTGFSVWFSWALMIHVYRDPRSRNLLCNYSINEFDVAFASAMLEYGRGSVSNKSRRDESNPIEAEMLGRLTQSGAVSGVENAWNPESTVVSEAPADASLHTISLAVNHQRNKALSKKCRRSSARFAGDEDDNTFAMLEFVHCASLNNNPFMLHLASDEDVDSELASQRILRWQLEQLKLNYDRLVSFATPNSMEGRIKADSERAAVDTRRAVVAASTQTSTQSPTIVRWRTASDRQLRIGIARSRKAFGMAPPSNGETHDTGSHLCNARMLMACKAPPRSAAPTRHTKSCVLWVDATQLTKRNTFYNSPVAGVSEALRQLATASAAASSTTTDSEGGTGTTARAISNAQSHADRVSNHPLTLSISGITRSVIMFECKLVVHADVVECASECGAQMSRLAAAAACDGGSQVAESRTAILPDSLQTSDVSCRSTPPTTPANPFSVGLVLQEAYRVSMSLTPQRHYPMTSMRLSAESNVEAAGCNSQSTDLAQLPNELLAVQDFQFSAAGRAPSPVAVGPSGALCYEVDMRVTLTVVGDSAIPLTKAIDVLMQHYITDDVVRQTRALVLFGATQCATLGAYAQSAADIEAGTNIMRTSKILDPDNTRCGFYTLAQAYVTGNAQVQRLFPTSAWHGVYGSGYSTGSIASPGRNCTNVTSDRRLTTVLYTNKEQVDRLTTRSADTSFVRNTNEHTFARTPYELRGIPRKVYAGVHSLTTPLHSAFEAIRKAVGTQDRDTVESIQVLPVSPWTESVPALCSEPSWYSFRNKTHGLFPQWHSHRSDSTPKELSVLNTPFFDAMRVRATSERDNLYETIDENMSSCFVIGSAIGELARMLSVIHLSTPPRHDARANLVVLREVGDRFFATSSAQPLFPAEAALFCDFSVLVSLLYPIKFCVGDLLIPKFHEKSSHACLVGKCNNAGAVLEFNRELVPEDMEYANMLWNRLRDVHTGPWNALCDFIICATEESCRFDLTLKDRKVISEINEQFVRSAWYMHSPNGVTPPTDGFPTAGRASPKQVAPGDAMGVYVDRPDAVEPNRRLQRGAIVGVKVGGLQQVLTLLNASHMRGPGAKGIRVQHALNEGGMLQRVSSCAMIATGRKGASPVGSENDEMAFGTFAAKQAQAQRQMDAWLINNELLFEATRFLTTPKEANTKLMRGDYHAYKNRMETKAQWDSQNPRRVSCEEKEAVEAMRRAVMGE